MALLRRNRPGLAREITITLVVKIVLIYLLWLAFFSNPLDDKLTGPAVGDALFGTLPAETNPADEEKIRPKEGQ